jgi:hypothetical protein
MDAYKNAHNAVRAERGPASLWQCIWCLGDADHWSYDHADENERVDGSRRYSSDVNRYRPMCARDHRIYDRLHRENATFDRFEQELLKARSRYPREAIAAMCERRATRLQTYVNGKRRTTPLTVVQTTIQRVMA